MRFRRVRHFALTSLVFFIATGSAIGHQHRQLALPHMLLQHESDNANLIKVSINTRHERQFSSFIEESGNKLTSELEKFSQVRESNKDVLAPVENNGNKPFGGFELYADTPPLVGEIRKTEIWLALLIRGALGTLAI